MSQSTVEIRVGLGSCGIASGAEAVRTVLEEEARKAGHSGVVKAVGCNGMCHREPLIEVVDETGERTVYGDVTVDMAQEVARRHLVPKNLLGRGRMLARGIRGVFLRNGSGQALDDSSLDLRDGPAAAYLSKQKRIVLENCGRINPLKIEEYRSQGGYEALRKCLEELSPEELIKIVDESGLRGRGGAGFPTGRKWSLARMQEEQTRYVICNGDEGDPGAFMDRSILEGDPHRVVEGLAIAAYATGASEGFFYIRAEYPLAVRHIRQAIRDAEEHGFLGNAILGTDFDLAFEVREGAGAFVCGEETALIASLEGKRGTPRLRPPYPVQEGFRGYPTTINNVESLACLPWILRNGSEAFAAWGTESSKGTKVFALAGKIKRGGLIEVPMGLTIREIVEDIGGGIQNGRPFKAVQLGGPSGGCLPARLADTPIDYEALAKTGAIMGSGGMVVLDDRDCMVDMARFFLGFTQAESCGKCTFCRVGTKRMLEILERLCEGKGLPNDIENLEELAFNVKRASLCGLGQTAPSPVLTTLEYFRNEYEAHLHEKRCPGGCCPALIQYVVNDACIGCTMCAQVCPVDAIDYRPHEKHFIKDGLCTRCGMCVTACQDEAIDIE